jgi:hypothetical protein
MNAADEYEAYQERFDVFMRKHWQEAELAQMQPSYEQTELYQDEHGVVMFGKKARCPSEVKRGTGWKAKDRPTWPYNPCKNTAGYGTTHEGFGKCYRCDGHNGRGLKQGAILMALAYADELNTTPWEALLQQCRLLSNQVHWLRARVYEYEELGGVAALKPGGDGFWAVEMLESRGDRLAKVAKSCLDAGIAQQLVQQINLEAQNMATAAMTAADSIGLEGELRDRFLEAMGNKLFELEGTHVAVSR